MHFFLCWTHKLLWSLRKYDLLFTLVTVCWKDRWRTITRLVTESYVWSVIYHFMHILTEPWLIRKVWICRSKKWLLNLLLKYMIWRWSVTLYNILKTHISSHGLWRKLAMSHKVLLRWQRSWTLRKYLYFGLWSVLESYSRTVSRHHLVYILWCADSWGIMLNELSCSLDLFRAERCWE